MHVSSRVRGIVAAVVVVMTLIASSATAQADDPPPAPVRSEFENYWGAGLHRDCGFAQPVPGQSGQAFWLFCDTAVTNLWGEPAGFIPGSTAARGPFTPGMVPTVLSELPTPPAAVPAMPNHNGPAQFLPTPTGLYERNGTTPCGTSTGPDDPIDSYPASWISGLTTIPSTNRFLITYIDVCVQTGWVFVVSRFGMVEYTPSTNTLSGQTTVFSAAPGADLPLQQQNLGSPIFGSDGNLYVFSKHCTAADAFTRCTGGSIWEARVASGSRGTASAYRWRNGSSWVTSAASATSIVSGATPTDISVHSYANVGRGIVIVENNSLGGDYRLFSASTPSGTFSALGGPRNTGGGCEVPPGVDDFCHAMIGHPELSTTSQLAISYYAVEDRHVRVTTSPW